jgi:hypothetical protein
MADSGRRPASKPPTSTAIKSRSPLEKKRDVEIVGKDCISSPLLEKHDHHPLAISLL